MKFTLFTDEYSNFLQKQVCSIGFSQNWLKGIFQENDVLNYELFYCYFTLFSTLLIHGVTRQMPT